MDSVSNNYVALKVLLIDDQAFIRRLVMRMLSQMGFREFLHADDGAEGLKVCRDNFPDLIICDVEMQPLTGLEFLKMLRENDDVKYQSVPVVFLTSHAESNTVKQAHAYGVDAFLVKPPSLKSLQGRIDFALSGGKWD